MPILACHIPALVLPFFLAAVEVKIPKEQGDILSTVYTVYYGRVECQDQPNYSVQLDY